MNRTTSVFRLLLKDRLSWFVIPWTIVFSSFFINLLIFFLIKSSEEAVSITGGLSSIYIYMGVMGILIVPQTFPFALGLGIRRTDYFWGTTAAIGFVSAASAIVVVLLSAVERALSGWGGLVNFFSMPFIVDEMILSQLWFYAALMLHLFFTGFAVAAIFRRYGGVILMLVLGGLFVAFSVFILLATYYGWWSSILEALSGLTVMKLINWASVGTLFYMALSYLLLRKSTV